MKRKNSILAALICLVLVLSMATAAEAFTRKRTIEVKGKDGSYTEIALSRKASRQLHRSVKNADPPAPEIIFGRYIKARRVLSVRIHVPMKEARPGMPTVRRNHLWKEYSEHIDSMSNHTYPTHHERHI